MHKTKKGVYIFKDGHTYFLTADLLQWPQEFLDALSVSGDFITSPMPGKIFKLLVSQSQIVKAGQELVVVEAMKMEHTLKAPFDAKIKDVFIETGLTVDSGQKLLELEKQV